MEKFLTNYTGPSTKKRKTDEEVKQRKQEYDRTVRVREFKSHWLKLFEWLEYHVTNSKGRMYCKICRKYEPLLLDVEHSKLRVSGHTTPQTVTQKTILRFQAKHFKPGTSEAEKALLSMNKSVVPQLCLLFRNAHALAKTG